METTKPTGSADPRGRLSYRRREMPKASVRAVGAMSGTSLDGVDAAEVFTDGHEIFGFGNSDYRAYTLKERAALRAVLGRWPGPGLEKASEVLIAAHLQVLRGFDEAQLVGFHGQTLAHDPAGQGTHQLGDGAALAAELGKPVVWDFRSADVGMGGEGAPLAPFFHHACARWIEARDPLVFLNLGGVGNITWVDPRVEKPEAPGACLAFDTGPANAPINDLVAARLGLECDLDGAVARKGRVQISVLEALAQHPFFDRPPPKSLDRDDFAQHLVGIEALSTEDAAATLTAFSAGCVAHALNACPSQPTRVLVTGGGRRNPVMMENLSRALPCTVEPVEAVGLDGDMLEAQAFAYLAVRVSKGLPTSCPTTTGVPAPVGGGQISRV